MDGYCAAALLILCVFVTAWIVLVRNVTGPRYSLRELLDAYRSATNHKERILAACWGTVLVFRMGTIAGVLALGASAFAALGAICGMDVETLKVLQRILLDLYEFLERMLRPGDKAPADAA